MSGRSHRDRLGGRRRHFPPTGLSPLSLTAPDNPHQGRTMFPSQHPYKLYHLPMRSQMFKKLTIPKTRMCIHSKLACSHYGCFNPAVLIDITHVCIIMGLFKMKLVKSKSRKLPRFEGQKIFVPILRSDGQLVMRCTDNLLISSPNLC